MFYYQCDRANPTIAFNNIGEKTQRINNNDNKCKTNEIC